MIKEKIYQKLNLSKWRFILLFCLGGTIPVILLGIFAVTSFSNSMKNQILKDNFSTAKIASKLIEQHLQNSKEILQAIAGDKDIIQIIEQRKFKNFDGILEKYHIRLHYFQYLSIYTPEGSLRGISPSSAKALQENVFFQDWYKGVTSQWEPYISNVYRVEVAPFPYVVAIVIPILNAEKQVIGMVMAPFKIETIRDWARSSVVGKEGFLFVVDRTGAAVVHPQIDEEKPPQNLLGDPSVEKVIGQNEGAELITYQNKRHFTAYTFIPSIGWGTIVRQPYESAMASIRLVSFIILIACVFLIIANSMLGVYLGKIYGSNLQLRQTIESKNTALEIANKNLEKSNKDLELINKINSTMNQSLNIDEIFRSTLNELIIFTQAEAGSISLFDARSKKLKLAAVHGIPEDAIHKYEQTSLEQSYAGLTLKALQPMRKTSSRQNPLFEDAVENQLGLTSFLCMPIIHKVEPVGVITLGMKADLYIDYNEDTLKIISDQMAAASENARLYQKVEQQREQIKQDSENKSTFVRNISHQLRTPLNAVISYAQILQYDKKLDESQEKYVESIVKGGKLLQQLIEGIVDLSKIEAGIVEFNPEIILADEIVKEVQTLLSSAVSSKKLKMVFKYNKNLSFNADKIRMQQIFYNLLNNAINFSKDSGKITMTIAEQNAEILFSIKDEGPNIAPEDYDLVFKEFQQINDESKRIYKGTGIAMALSKKYIELHHGRIRIENKEKKGVIFHFTIPKENAAVSV